jgi:hypothetical protein
MFDWWVRHTEVSLQSDANTKNLNPRSHILSVSYVTLWSKVILEKLTGFQPVKKFPVFYRTRRFITAFTSAHRLSLSYVTDQISPKYFQLHRFSSLISSSGRSIRPSVRHILSSSFCYPSALASSTAEVVYNLIRTTSVNLEFRIGPSQTLHTTAQNKTS